MQSGCCALHSGRPADILHILITTAARSLHSLHGNNSYAFALNKKIEHFIASH